MQGGGHLRRHRDPDGEEQEPPVQVVDDPTARVGPAERAPGMPDVDRQQGAVDLGAGVRHAGRRSTSGVRSASEMPSPIPGTGPGGSMWMRPSSLVGIGPNESMTGPSSRSGASSRSASAVGASTAPSIITKALPRNGSGSSGSGGSRSSRMHDVTASSRSRVHPRVRREDLGRPRQREEQRPGVDLGDREDVELHGADDADVGAAASHRPEQLRLVVGVDPVEDAVAGDQLDRGDRRAGQAVPAAEPAVAAAEGVARDADVRRRARPARPARAARGLGHLGPDRARPRPAPSGPRRRRRWPPSPGAQQDRVAQVGQGGSRCGRSTAVRPAGRARAA